MQNHDKIIDHSKKIDFLRKIKKQGGPVVLSLLVGVAFFERQMRLRNLVKLSKTEKSVFFMKSLFPAFSIGGFYHLMNRWYMSKKLKELELGRKALISQYID